jgi:hypothetical protein
MDKLIEYILQFGNLNSQQLALITSSGTEILLQKDEYFQSQGESLSRLVL